MPHRTQPPVGHFANIHVLATLMPVTRPVELPDRRDNGRPEFRNPGCPEGAKLALTDVPGIRISGEPRMRRYPAAVQTGTEKIGRAHV